MAIGISVVGPRKLPHPACAPLWTGMRHYTKLEFETNPGVAHAVKVSYAIVLELQLADAVMVVGMARDLIPQKILDHVNMGAWGAYFTEYSSRDGLRNLLDELGNNVHHLHLPRDASYLEVLETRIAKLPFLAHLPHPVNYEWQLAAKLEDPCLTYDEALPRISGLLARFASDPFLHVTDLNPYGQRIRAVP